MGVVSISLQNTRACLGQDPSDQADGLLQPRMQPGQRTGRRPTDRCDARFRLAQSRPRDAHALAVERRDASLRLLTRARSAPQARRTTALADLEDAPVDAPGPVTHARRRVLEPGPQAVHRPGDHPNPVGQEFTVTRIVDVGLDDGRVDPQPVPPDDSSRTGELHQTREQRLQHGRVDELRETKERFGVGDALTPDPAELPVHEAPAHLALAFIETPSIEMLEHQHPEDDRGGSAQSPAPSTQRMAAGERVNDHVNQRLVIEQRVDLAKDGIPELVRVGQQHLEDTALRVRATDHGTSEMSVVSACAAGALLSFHNRVGSGHSSTKTRVRTPSGALSPRHQRAKRVHFAP